MNCRIVISLAVIAVMATLDRDAGLAWAQQIRVQQPVIRQFSATTTISVPDRGSTFIGGVSRAGAARSTFGPFRSGTSAGIFRERAGMSAHVWIHDLDAMDRRLLNQAAVGSRSDEPVLSDHAEHAYQSLMSRQK